MSQDFTAHPAASSFSSTLHAAMREALDAARHGVRGANPLVGAAVVSPEGSVVTGFHAGPGAPHAEVDAIARARAAGLDLSRSTLLVTLEPCNHTGRTGPCTQAILEAGIGHVVHAIDDPHATASGGAAFLRAHGVRVGSGLEADRARALNARWLAAKTEGRPFFTLKIAQSLDGRIAAADGTSQWITNEESRRTSHALRARVDAVLVGSGTLAADDPRLTVRLPGTEAPAQPVPVVMGHSDLPDDSHLARNPRTIHVRTHDPRVLAAELAARGLEHVLVEGGATIASAFLAADLVDELLVFTAPILLGDGRSSTAGLTVPTLDAAPRFAPDPLGDPPRAHVPLGTDLLTRFVPAPRESPEPPIQHERGA